MSVVEQASVDNRRKLVLVRRDGVEHLIMTGGPVDVVIETGIGASSNVTIPLRSTAKAETKAEAEAGAAVTTSPVFGRQPRTLGQVVNE